MLKITNDVLLPDKWNACQEGLDFFNELFPNGATLAEAIDGLVKSDHEDWAKWLFDKCRRDADYKDQTLEGYLNSGYRNSGYRNSGNFNSGSFNSGYRNSGYRNSGNFNSGSFNSGDRNSGNFNSGSFNSGDRNSGHFNSITPKTILVFNKDCELDVWNRAKKPNMLYDIYLTYNDGDRLQTRTYKEAWRVAWDTASKEDRELLKDLPNFDAKVFEEITGINVCI